MEVAANSVFFFVPDDSLVSGALDADAATTELAGAVLPPSRSAGVQGDVKFDFTTLVPLPHRTENLGVGYREERYATPLSV